MMRICFLIGTILLGSCYSHGPFLANDPESKELLLQALSTDEPIEWAGKGWYAGGINAFQSGSSESSSSAGVFVITATHLLFQTWHEGDGQYYTAATTDICSIRNVLQADSWSNRGQLVVLADRPDTYTLTSPAGWPQPENAKVMAGLLRQRMAECGGATTAD